VLSDTSWEERVLDAVDSAHKELTKLRIDFAVVQAKQNDLRKGLWFCIATAVGLIVERIT